MTQLRHSITARYLKAVVVAAACCLVLATRVYVHFDAIRIKVISEPVTPANEVVRVRAAADTRASDLPTHIALIVRLHNLSSTAQRFTLRINDYVICDSTVDAGVARRVDCVLNQARGTRVDAHDIVVAGPGVAWQLDYFEIATHHGSSTEPLTLRVLPAASEAYGRAAPLWIAFVALLLVGLLLLPVTPPVSVPAKYGVRGAIGLTTTLFVLAMISSLVSPYRLLLSVGTFTGWLAASLAPRLWWIVLWLRLLAQPPAVRMWRWVVTFVGMCRAGHRVVASGLALALLVVGLVWGTRALGGSDTYGYVSEADLWLRGNLKIDQAFATSAPWPAAASSFAPLGYVPSPVDDRLIVPVYSPGLPILLAIAKGIAGQTAMFWVVPLCAALLVIATYELGRRLESRQVGLIGAWLVATSPVVLAHTSVTMTDVPVAAAWTGAFCLLVGTTWRISLGAGLLAGAAIMIRPNLAPLAGVMALRYGLDVWAPATRRRAIVHGLIFGLAALPGALVVAAINQSLFGSPLASGYGNVTDLFAMTRAATNLRHYLGWLIEAHTPVVLLGLLAVVVPIRRVWPHCRDRRVFVVIGLFVVVLWGIYCAWGVFDSWWFTRFLLSSWPFIMLGVGATAMTLVRSVMPSIRPLIVCCVIALGLVQIRFAVIRHVFDVKKAEGRNVAIARLAHQVTTPGSVLLSFNHSGSLRYYAGRMTLNYANLDERSLDQAVAWLTARGIHAYAVLEELEIRGFRQRFARARLLSALDQPPLGIYLNPGRVLIFDLSTPGVADADPVVFREPETGWWAVPPVAREPFALAPAGENR